MKNTNKKTAAVVINFEGKPVTVNAGTFAIADVTSPSHLSRAGRIYAFADTVDALEGMLDNLRRSSKVWLQIVTIA